MRWIDVFGPPGVGKSTICDHFWHPHAIPHQSSPLCPDEWREFAAEVERLLDAVSGHWSFQPCLGMTRRSIRKMAAVNAKQDERVYIQTGFAQRGLGFGWRLKYHEEVRRFYELMPVSLGVVSLSAPVSLVQERNRGREAQGENRDFMVPLMERPRQIAIEVLEKRGVPLLKLDTSQPPKELRNRIVKFRDSCLQSIQAVQSAAA